MSQPAILIVEDEAIVAEDLSDRVRHLGYEVAGVLRTGEAAVDFVRRQRPALVLMDVRLAGEMDGITAAMEIHRECDLPVVFLTAHADEVTINRAQLADAFGYILKPFDVRDLRIQIEMAIYKHAKAEEQRRVNRTLRALTASNRAQLLAKSEPDLLNEVCRIITEECGYSMVWIGYAENDATKSVRPMAHAGFEEGYLETLQISWADTERGRGPTGTAIRSGQPCRCTQMLTDPLFEPWRPEALKRGYASSLAVPLLEEGTALGAITLYSGLPAGFAPDEVKLIGNLAHDLAFGITTLRLRRARRVAEEQIRSLNRELENRVQERTAKLNETVAALEAEMFQRHRLEREILEISEREQSRLGSDLHDGLGQELTGIAILGDVLAKQLAAQNNPLTHTAGKIAAYVRTALTSTRQLAKGHYPIELECHGLRLALQDLARQTSHRTRIHCELRHDGAEPKLEKSAEIHIYRIIQECIGNAVKHAMPNQIIIESHAGDGMHTFSVTDDGCGFAVPAENPGMGLHLMRYRARVIGAKLTIEQPAAGGCRITCRLREGVPQGGMSSPG